MVSVSCTSKPLDILNDFQRMKKLMTRFCELYSKTINVLNGFRELYSKTISGFIQGA